MPRPFAQLGRTWFSIAIVATVLGSALCAQAQEPVVPPAGGGGEATSPVEQFQQAIEAGNAALQSKNYDAAVDAFSQAIKISEFAPEPYAGRAEALVGLKEYEAADKDFGEALSKNPDFVPALVARGEMRLELGATDLALADFQQAIEQERSNPRAIFGLGKAYVLLGGGQQGIRPLTRHLALEGETDEKRAESFRLRAQGYASLGKFDEAYKDIEESLKIKPDDYETYSVLALIMYRQQNFLGAARAITVAISKYVPDEENPQPYIQGYLTKAAILVDLARQVPSEEVRYQIYEAMIYDCNQLLAQLGEAPQYAAARSAALFSRGVGFRLQGRFEYAIQSFSDSIELNTESGEAYFRRGICFFNIGESQLALADFKQADIINFDDPRTRLWEGLTYTQLGKYYDAVRSYGLAIAESDRYVPAYVNRGLVYMQLGEFEKAIADFDGAIRLEPNAATHYFKRGVAYIELGDHEKAADSFASAIEYDNKLVPAYRYMAKSLTALGLDTLAEQYSTKGDEVETAAAAEAAEEAEPPAATEQPTAADEGDQAAIDEMHEPAPDESAQ